MGLGCVCCGLSGGLIDLYGWFWLISFGVGLLVCVCFRLLAILWCFVVLSGGICWL